MMLRDIATKLRERLVAKRCPIQSVIFEEQTETVTGARERIVIERDRDAADAFGPVRGAHPNPKHVLTRAVPFKITAYIQSAKTGALVIEHEDRADRLVETILASLDRVLREDLQVFWSPTSGGFVKPADFDKSPKQPGLVYELRFSAVRSIPDVNWTGDAKPELAITDGLISNRTDVGLENGPEGAPVVTGCGGN